MEQNDDYFSRLQLNTFKMFKWNNMSSPVQNDPTSLHTISIICHCGRDLNIFVSRSQTWDGEFGSSDSMMTLAAGQCTGLT